MKFVKYGGAEFNKVFDIFCLFKTTQVIKPLWLCVVVERYHRFNSRRTKLFAEIFNAVHFTRINLAGCRVNFFPRNRKTIGVKAHVDQILNIFIFMVLRITTNANRFNNLIFQKCRFTVDQGSYPIAVFVFLFCFKEVPLGVGIATFNLVGRCAGTKQKFVLCGNAVFL